MKKKRVVFIVCIVIMILNACSFENENYQFTNRKTNDNLYENINIQECSFYEDLSPLPQEIQNIIYNNGTFFDVENQREYTKNSYKIKEDEKLNRQLQWLEYIVFDFDDDGEKELVVMLYLGGGDPYMRVFDKQEDMVYAYPFVYRGFLHVYEDGGIYGASAADQFMIYKVKFNKNKQEETIILDATSEETESGQFAQAWYVKGQKVTEEEFLKFCDEYFEKNKDIPWSDRGIDSQLLQVELSKIPVQKKNKIVYQLDLTGDGKDDVITVNISKIKRLWKRKAVISVEDSTGEELWCDEMELSDTSGKLYYLCKMDGRYCLLRYITNYTKGDGKYSFEVFYPKKTGEDVFNSEEIEFKTYAEKKYVRDFSATNMDHFRNCINEYLANGILLFSIDGGKVKYSTENTVITYTENYKKIIPIDIQNEDPYVENQLDILQDRILEEMKQK